MPTEIFVRQTTDEGEEAYVPLEDWNEVEIPDEVIRDTDPYRSVLEESITRRKRIASMRDQLAELERSEGNEGDDVEVEDDDTKPPKKENADRLQFSNRDELMDYVYSQLTEREKSEQAVKQQREKKLNELAEKHNITDAALRDVLAKSQDPETVAETLGRIALRFDDTQGGDVQTPRLDDIGARVAARFGYDTD